MMRLKELKNGEYNLFDFISFFDGIPDTKPYFTELTYLYGNRILLPAIEELLKADGLGSIGLIFDLKSQEWGDLENISNIIKENVTMETTIITNKNDASIMSKNSNVSNNDNNKDYIIPFDENEEYEQSKTSKENSIISNENINNENEGTTETTYQGFNKDRINLLIRIFKTYPNYRYEIYKDIVNMLCLQVYDCVV
ncbi:MAG: hypothetical protein GX889_02245 [Clostridiales bacterium]|nr:hypothetical protein [Clostridiales bacterium]